MEQRIPLPQGETVQQFVIDRVIGFGASCLVYEAHYLDSSNHRKEIILKECYPCNADAARIGNKIIWSNSEEQEKAFLRFDNAYEIAAKIQNVAGAKSVSVYSLDKLTENGTQYVATIPNGTSYDKNESKDIADIIRTALALTNAVGLYHKAGYLHLDIKPSNFIPTEDQTGKGKNIILFDVDTVVSQDDIQGGNLRSVSYSKECAAPEQKTQQIKKLCPATDLFAVGAVLFERIMNRPVDSSDSTLFSEWEFDTRFDVKKVNPKAKRLLTEIFHKTLAANVKRRYRSAEELAKALRELLDVIDSPSPYIYSYPIETNCTFVSRNRELAEIYNGLKNNSRVFVKGAGGIGKTELVRKYASLYQDEYDAVVFMLYNGSISECLNEIKILGVDSKNENNKSLLKEICDENILLILDNYDVAPNESAGLNELFELNCKVIVTTRTDFSERNPNACFVEVLGLSAEVLRRIFENGIRRELSDSEFDALKPILHIGQECTYFWSMAARLANEGAYTISEIVEKVLSGLDDLSESEDIFDTKDGKNINTTVAEAMLVLFKLDELTDKEYDVLKAMYFLDCLNMDKRQVKEMLSFSEKKLMNSFNALVKKGYIEKINVASREVYRISDVLRNVLEYREEFDISKTELVTSFIDKKFFINNNDIESAPDSLVSRDRVYYIFSCLFTIFSNIRWSILGNAIYCVDKIYDLSMGEEYVFRFTKKDCATVVLDNIWDFLNQSEISSPEHYKAIIISVTRYCSWFRSSLLYGKQSEPSEFAEIIEKLFHLAVCEMESNHIIDIEMMDALCKPIVEAIKHNYSMSSIIHCRFYFSSDVLNQIISIYPYCVQNDNAHITNSFKVICLRNTECEKAYLRSTLYKLKSTKRNHKSSIAYLAIIMIALNGKEVSTDIDDDLRALRIRVLLKCRKMFLISEGKVFPNQQKTNICDLIPEIKSSEIDGILTIITEGIKRFWESLASSENTAIKTKEKNYYHPSFISNDGDYCVDLFLSSMDKIDSSDCLYYFISEFDNAVKSNCSFKSEDLDQQKFIDVSTRLENKLKEMVETGKFVDVLFDSSCGSYYIDCSEVKAKLDYTIAVMYTKIRNYDLAYKYMESAMEYSRSIIKAKNKIEDNCFVLQVFSLIENNASHLAVLLLCNLINYVRELFNITDDADVRLYSLYYWLVLSAHSAIEEMEDDSSIEISKNAPHNLLATKEDYESLIEKYTVLIRKISGQEYHP